MGRNRPVLDPRNESVKPGQDEGRRSGMGGANNPAIVPTVPTAPPLPPAAAPQNDKDDAKRALEAPEPSAERDGRSRGKGQQELRKKAEAAEKQLQELHYFNDNEREELKGRVLYRRIESTQEWAENNYYHVPLRQQVADLIPVGPFWLDYARHDGKGPFLSTHLADASRNFTEMMFALAVLDLPFTAGKHEVAYHDRTMTLTPSGPAIAFHEEVRAAAAPGDTVPVLVGQNFYRHAERYRMDGSEKVDKFVTGEFLTQTVYGGQVVVSNPTSSRQRLSVLLQMPVGSIPIGDGRATRSILLNLEPYRTQAVNYLFYFPRSGKFAQFPAHVSQADQVIAAAKPAMFQVVEKLTKPDTSS